MKLSVIGAFSCAALLGALSWSAGAAPASISVGLGTFVQNYSPGPVASPIDALPSILVANIPQFDPDAKFLLVAAELSFGSVTNHAVSTLSLPANAQPDPLGDSGGGQTGLYVSFGYFAGGSQVLPVADSLLNQSCSPSSFTLTPGQSRQCNDRSVSVPSVYVFGASLFSAITGTGVFQAQASGETTFAFDSHQHDFLGSLSGSLAINDLHIVYRYVCSADPNATRPECGTPTLGLAPPDGSVPEPATLALLGAGIAGLGLSRRRRERP